MDAYLQNTLLEAYALQGDASHAMEQLQRMQGEGVANAVSYNTVIKAIKKSAATDARNRQTF
jgi:pentatricopeptide repeat protein